MAEGYEIAFGNIPSTFDIRDYKIVPLKEFPKAFELEITPVKNQWLQSSCTAFACSTIVEYFHKIQTKQYVEFSTEFIYGNRLEEGDRIGDGLSIRKGLETIRKYGDPIAKDFIGNNNATKATQRVKENIDSLKEKAYPYRIEAYVRLNNEDEIKTALMKGGPVIASIKWYDKFITSGAILRFIKNCGYVNHSIIIYGWNENGWLVQNSWGVFFGNYGRCIIPYEETFNESWGTFDTIIENSIKKVSDCKLIRIICRLINSTINLLTSIPLFTHHK